ncbi:unnamed protein product [Clonostachys rosea f. rosea IK726]|uniref:Uncharacterized protein n=1 Tax=Clonostachys rosea f. rosea IK726 TaxID=1349383 RepID=A0ACA9TLT7_BIOOC|nr:unnamed protein product [Clonostachys rosea f. rosea IK726]
MPPVQGTFKVLPGLARSDVNNGPIRPMTSKQVKKAHKAATRQPKLSRAEQRRLELAEQERIRKEFEKERTAARARAARERKKQKELADKEAKRKNRLPLVAPRPSQETLSRFMWGNGSGLKRDGRGTTVAPAPMAAVREESAQPDEDSRKPDDEEVEVKKEPAMDERGADGADGADVHIEEPEQAHSPGAASPMPNAGAAQPEELPGLQTCEEPIQPTDLHVDEPDDLDTSRLSAHAQPEPLPEVHEGKEHSQTTDSRVQEPFPTSPPKPTGPRPSVSIESPPVAPGGEEALRSAASEGSFILGSSDMIDDESLLELTESFEPKPVSEGQKITAPCPQNAAIPIPETKIPDNLPDNLPDGIPDEASNDLAVLGAITQLFHDMDDDYDYEMIGDGVIESHEPPLEEAALPLPELHDDKTKVEAISEDQVSPLPQRSQRRGLERKVSSFFGSELDDELLLQLELPGDVVVSQCCQPVDEPPQHESPPKHNHNISSTGHRSTPSSPLAPRQRPPPSTQAILLNLDEYLPSSTQLALELDEDDIEEDFPAVGATEQIEQRPPTPHLYPSPASIQGVQPTMAAPQSAGPPARPQKRFFSSSGSNESLQLALHLSRRTAALEDIRRGDQRRMEAGFLQGRTISQPPRHQHKRPKIPSFATNYQVKHDPPVQNATRTAKTMIDEVSRTNSSNPAKGRQSAGNEQSSTKSAVAIKRNDTNKENIPPEPVTDDDLLGSGLPASQETEYGGAWIDDIGLDLVI